MKTPILFFLFFIFYFQFLFAQDNSVWQLNWAEEFNYTGLPDSSNWGYEVGHIRNNEQQYYTRADKKNVWVSDGLLTITGRKQDHINENYKSPSNDWRYKDSIAHYTSASINTLGKSLRIPVGQISGRLEIRAKMPKGGGMWPALWMMGTNRPEVGWPLCGEIDLMEFIGNHPEDIYSTVHYPGRNNKPISSGSKINNTTLSTRFHVYAMEWDHHEMNFFFDSLKFHTFIIDSAILEKDNPFRKDFYLLINMAMGAGWPGPIDDSFLPQKFEVDYVKFFSKQ